MKSSQIAATVLAALTTTGANAESMQVLEKTMCIPAWTMDGKIEIMSLCDASDLNKKYNLKIDTNGCAVSGQSLEADNGQLWEQASKFIWAETKEELEKQSLPQCTEYDAATYAVEL